MRPSPPPGAGPLRPAPCTKLAATMLAAVLSACATEPPPRTQMAVAQAAVERATGPAAADAPVELAAARDKITRAQLAYASKDYALARQLADQATADAALAEARARSVRSSQALAAVRDSIRQLRDEMARKE